VQGLSSKITKAKAIIGRVRSSHAMLLQGGLHSFGPAQELGPTLCSLATGCSPP